MSDVNFQFTPLLIQALLHELGFRVGDLDGKIGPQTKRAIRLYQATRDLDVDGIVGKDTRLALLKDYSTFRNPAKVEPDKSAIDDVINNQDVLLLKPKVQQPDSGIPGIPQISGLPGTHDEEHEREIVAARPAIFPALIEAQRVVHTLVWHCAATPEGVKFTMADIRWWHLDRGFNDIGYHYGVYLDGAIHTGRPISRIGAHVQNFNTGTIGCVYIGGVTVDSGKPKDTRTAAQQASMLWLTQELTRIHSLNRIAGHNEYTNKKACPSFYVPTDALGNILGFRNGIRVAKEIS